MLDLLTASEHRSQHQTWATLVTKVLINIPCGDGISLPSVRCPLETSVPQLLQQNCLIIVSVLMPLLNSHLHDVWSTMPLSDQLQLKTHEWRWFCKGKSWKYIVAFYCVSLLHHFARKPLLITYIGGVCAQWLRHRRTSCGTEESLKKTTNPRLCCWKLQLERCPWTRLLLRDDSSLEQRLLWFVAGPAQTWLPGFVLSSFAQ